MLTLLLCVCAFGVGYGWANWLARRRLPEFREKIAHVRTTQRMLARASEAARRGWTEARRQHERADRLEAEVDFLAKSERCYDLEIERLRGVVANLQAVCAEMQKAAESDEAAIKRLRKTLADDAETDDPEPPF